MKLLVALVFICVLNGAECQFALVEWQTAVLLTHPNLENPDSLVSQQKTMGCVAVTEKSVVVIHSLVDDSPNQVTVIPRGMVTAITALEVMNVRPKPDEKPKTGYNVARWRL